MGDVKKHVILEQDLGVNFNGYPLEAVDIQDIESFIDENLCMRFVKNKIYKLQLVIVEDCYVQEEPKKSDFDIFLETAIDSSDWFELNNSFMSIVRNDKATLDVLKLDKNLYGRPLVGDSSNMFGAKLVELTYHDKQVIDKMFKKDMIRSKQYIVQNISKSYFFNS